MWKQRLILVDQKHLTEMQSLDKKHPKPQVVIKSSILVYISYLYCIIVVLEFCLLSLFLIFLKFWKNMVISIKKRNVILLF